MNNDRFRNAFKKRIDKTKNKLDTFVKNLAVDIDQSLVLKSPVDTGRFKGNWVLGNGSVNASTLETTSPANNEAEINSLNINGQIIYITNSLPYAYRLEYESWSNQAPSGFVRITMAEVNSMAKQIGAELKLV